jgi:hypothetical protein
MSEYKDRPIYGVAVPAPDNQWHSRGLVYDRDPRQKVEMKRIDSTSRTFKTKKQAAKYGLELCKEWIDSNRP